MQWYGWTIIILIAMSYAQYTFPKQSNALLDYGWGNLNNVFSSKTNFQVPSPNQTISNGCNTIESPVCANGVTYLNSCFAMKSGVTEVIPGKC